ncbi:membrane integrity-associated transporter subunit PqiC [Azospirillum sp. YIM B02556]|uniref:Membrane integrity-associated transporter subunit PqiC n=1 Tax=Azospirillum endophyticum TaxID=2800326 RepID=A0ABS1FGS9_9PROT|nr:PqiC family protein [Azospirillum endophyticum]MBK1842538.1 membrane integrity-associated transporter subunit PqiC [Azospirillum endophyticum]
MEWVRGLRSAALALPLLVLAACQSTPDSRLYTLAVVAPAGTVQPLRSGSQALALGSLDLPMLIDRPQIVRRIDENRIETLEFDRWAEPLADGLRSTLAGDLAARLPGVTVLPVAGSSVGEGTAVLAVTVLRFDADATGRVVLDAQWSLSPGGGAPGRRSGPTRETVEVPSAGTGPDAQVRAMSQAVGTFADRVAAGVRR